MNFFLALTGILSLYFKTLLSQVRNSVKMVSSWEWKHLKILSQSSLLTAISFSDLHATEGHKLLKKEQTLLVESRMAWMLVASLLSQLTKASSVIQRGLDKLIGVGEGSLRTVMCSELSLRTSLNSGITELWIIEGWKCSLGEYHCYSLLLLNHPGLLCITGAGPQSHSPGAASQTWNVLTPKPAKAQNLPRNSLGPGPA